MIDFKDKRLEGSAILIRGNSPVSWIVRLGGLFTPKYGYNLAKFSHIETIYFNDEAGELYTISAVQPAVRTIPLRQLLEERKEHKELLNLWPSYEFNRLQKFRPEFLKAIEKSIGRPYGFISAITSEIDINNDASIWTKALNTLKPKKQIHCSALDAYLLQEARVLNHKVPAIEYTPDDCYYMRMNLGSRVEVLD